MILDDVIEEFNSGDSKSLIYFNNDIQLFFNYLKSIGRFEEIDPRGYGSEDWQNEYLIFLYQANKPEFYKWCNEILSDIDSDIIDPCIIKLFDTMVANEYIKIVDTKYYKVNY